MSYDISYINPETREIIKVIPYTAQGGTVPAEMDEDGNLRPATINYAEINITYNYSKYYYDNINKENGIRWFFNKTGSEVKDVLKRTIVDLILEEGGYTIRNENDYNKLLNEEFHVLISFLLKANSSIHISRNIFVDNSLEVKVNDYWKPTPANAARPLVTILSWIDQNPNGIFIGD